MSSGAGKKADIHRVKQPMLIALPQCSRTKDTPTNLPKQGREGDPKASSMHPPRGKWGTKHPVRKKTTTTKARAQKTRCRPERRRPRGGALSFGLTPGPAYFSFIRLCTSLGKLVKRRGDPRGWRWRCLTFPHSDVGSIRREKGAGLAGSEGPWTPRRKRSAGHAR